MGYDPVVFISSTSEDLKEHRQIAVRAALATGFAPRTMEYFSACGHLPTLRACLEMVDEAEVIVVLVADRYGWVPEDVSNPDQKSITWLECDHARFVNGKEVLAFLLEPTYAWPAEWREDYRLVTSKDLPDDEFDRVRKEVRRNEKKLAEFKRELSTYFRGTFTDAASVRALVSEALAAWRARNRPATMTIAPQDPGMYMKVVEDKTRQIRITGLSTNRAEPYVFGIDEIYIPLTTASLQETEHSRFEEGREQERTIALEQALRQRRLVLIGDPGSGKSTFVRRVAYELCRTLRGVQPPDSQPFLPPGDRRLPILITVSDFARFLEADQSPKPIDSPGWIPYFLAQQSEEYRWGVDEVFFRRKFDEGDCLLMVDGLDEAPNRHMRERIARIFESAARSYPKLDVLITTRPQTNVGDAVLDGGFHSVRIGALRRPDIDVFFDHFASALDFPEPEAHRFKESLDVALNTRLEIAEMATNPVMLTALAVLQHNDHRLPEYRVDLYALILGWLAQAKQEIPGRYSAQKRLDYLRKLALHMQDAGDGRRVQISVRSAAEFLATAFCGTVEKYEDLLEVEMQDSGIISKVGSDLRFWHLSFQEFLAAREIASLTEAQQISMVVSSGKLYRPEWRETMRLLGGLLCQQGEAKIEGFIEAILTATDDKATVAQLVDCITLLSAMMQDLSLMGYWPKTAALDRGVKRIVSIRDAGSDDIEIFKHAEAADFIGQIGDPGLKKDNWLTIPSGTFLMGAQRRTEREPNYDPDARDDESPVHEVSLHPFRIKRDPVTVKEFGEFIREGGYFAEKYWIEGFGLFSDPEDWAWQTRSPNRPVVGVSWLEAAAYCRWRAVRLPTEAEWERAARGPLGSKYPWGDQPGIDHSRANYDMQVGHSTPAGLYPAGNTLEGLCDMLGNVWEWCEDWFGTYGVRPQHDPAGPGSGGGKVLRGGSWLNVPKVVRVSNRPRYVPSDRFLNVGFRCAADLD